LAGHASDPEIEQPPAPEVRSLCATCHGIESARPDWFPQVDAMQHAAEESCDECHLPHRPGM
jgi:hypothetical protein